MPHSQFPSSGDCDCPTTAIRCSLARLDCRRNETDIMRVFGESKFSREEGVESESVVRVVPLLYYSREELLGFTESSPRAIGTPYSALRLC